jgi:hypothetical protein
MFHVLGRTHVIMGPATADDQHWACVGFLHNSHFPVWCSFKVSALDTGMYYGQGMIIITYVDDTLFFGPDLKGH